MLDMNASATPIPAWQTSLQPGDVVLFRFPCTEHDPAVAAKIRTCLVLSVQTRNGHGFAEIAYGTSANTRANVGDEIHVVTPAAMAGAGLRKPTRFVCARRQEVSLCDAGWDLSRGHSTPIIGRLDPAARARMAALRAGIADRRDQVAALQPGRGASAQVRSPAGFTVEHRRRRRLPRSVSGGLAQ